MRNMRIGIRCSQYPEDTDTMFLWDIESFC